MAEAMGKAAEGRSGPDPVLAAALAWAVPGAGHAYAGKRAKAALFFVLVTGTFLFGLALSGFKCVSWTQQPAWFIGQAFAGIMSVAVAVVDPAKDDIVLSEALDIGTLFTTVAGLLNLLVALNAMNEAKKSRTAGEGDDAGRSGKGAGKAKVEGA